ncbi:MAG: type II toxin-antitoxin system RelE/ParE family toxin [Phyllobacteriaceae bacterium]|nr:type II toxin-antitoxin system RelE/ParE family toxin [Phyllobacteriaceae bacterium]
MSSSSPTGYRLTPRALDDLDDIWRYTAETWSIDQADTYIDELTGVFEMLAAMPDMGREYSEIDPPVRIHTHKSHLVVYLMAENKIIVVRILGGRQNWQEILNSIN